MRRKMASEYLLEEHGVSLSPATLAKLAVVGGSPPFFKDGPFPIYDRENLDAFAIARLGRLRISTSDAPWAARKLSQSRRSTSEQHTP